MGNEPRCGPDQGDHGPGNGASRPPTDSGTGIAGKVELAAGADGGAPGGSAAPGTTPTCASLPARLRRGRPERTPTRQPRHVDLRRRRDPGGSR